MSAAKPPALPPGILLYQMAIGHYVSRALDLAARLGVADLLAAGPRRRGRARREDRHRRGGAPPRAAPARERGRVQRERRRRASR